jgi:hypothetical protein
MFTGRATASQNVWSNSIAKCLEQQLRKMFRATASQNV